MEAEEKKPNNKLKHQRGLRGWSQKKVALAIGTSKDMVSRWDYRNADDRNPATWFLSSQNRQLTTHLKCHIFQMKHLSFSYLINIYKVYRVLKTHDMQK